MDQRHRTTIEVSVDDQGVQRLGQTVQAALDPQVVALFTQAVERTSGAVEGLQAAFERQAAARDEAARRAQEGAEERRETARRERQAREQARAERQAANDRRREQEREENEAEQRARERRQAAVSFLGGAASMFGAAAAGSFTAALAGALPIIGQGASGVLSGIQGFYQEYAQAQTAFTRAMAPSGLDATQVPQEMFTRFGLGPGDAAGAVGNTAGRSGREGQGVAEILATQLRLQSLLGVQGGAGLVGAEESRGGRSADASRLMLQAVSTGLEAGIRTTRLDAYLGNISSWVEKVRTEGIDFSAESALQLVRGFAALGPAFQGEASVARARELPQALKQAADQGGIGGALSFEAARRVAGPNASIEDLLALTEGGGTREQQSTFQRSFLELAREAAGNDVLGLRYLLRSVGAEMSIPQLRALQNGDLSAFTATPPTTATAERKLGERQALFNQMGEPAQFAAQQAFARMGLGGDAGVQGAARQIMLNDLELARSVLPQTAALVEKTSRLINQLLKGEGKEAARGLLNTVGDQVGLQKLGDDWVEGIKGGVLNALREFFSMDTFKLGVVPVVTKFLEATGASDELTKQLTEAAAREQAARNPGATPAPPPPAAPAPAATPETGPQGALLPGSAPRMLRDAARLLDGAATQFERSMGTQDGTLGFG